MKSYTIFYGYPTEDAMHELKKKDLAIIEPSMYSNEQVQALHAAETIAIGYLSVMEAPAWNRYRQERLQPDHYLTVSGAPVYFPKWDSYLMDLRCSSYRRLLLEEIRSHIATKGFDGIFLDTVGDIDDHVADPKLKHELCKAYAELLRDISREYPHLALIQNRGFASLDAAAPYICGFLWEDWRGALVRDPWVKPRLKRLTEEQANGLTVFTVSAGMEAINAKAAGQRKFIHLDAPDGYDRRVH